jgi:hypothetical protein
MMTPQRQTGPVQVVGLEFGILKIDSGESVNLDVEEAEARTRSGFQWC